MKLVKGKKTFFAIYLVLIIGLLAVIFIGQSCDNCNAKNNIYASYCGYCGKSFSYVEEALPEIPHEKAIIGKWKTLFEYYYEYTFYEDGTCEGYYCGRNPDYEPALHPEFYILGSGNGTWSFEDGNLKIVYTGEGEKARKGNFSYSYEFNEDFSQLKIHGLEHDAVWLKVTEE